MREMGMLTVKVLMETRQKGHLQWVVHSVAYFFWLVKNLKYTRPQGSSPFLALAATSLSCNTALGTLSHSAEVSVSYSRQPAISQDHRSACAGA